MFWSAGCSLYRAEGFSCSLCVCVLCATNHCTYQLQPPRLTWRGVAGLGRPPWWSWGWRCSGCGRSWCSAWWRQTGGSPVRSSGPGTPRQRSSPRHPNPQYIINCAYLSVVDKSDEIIALLYSVDFFARKESKGLAVIWTFHVNRALLS